MSFSIHRNGGSSTAVVELSEISVPEASWNGPKKTSRPASVRTVSDRSYHTLGHNGQNESLPTPTTAVEKLQQWNHPTINVYRTMATFWGFLVMGMNDSAYGVGIPSVLCEQRLIFSQGIDPICAKFEAL
jgi:hypothetical protein